MKYLQHLVLLAGITILPGCEGLMDWGKTHFEGGKKASYDKEKVESYIKHRIIYHHFHTQAIFDAFWLSDEIKTIYSDIHARMYGKSDDSRNTFLRRQLKANSHFVSFYVLASKDVALGSKGCKWNMYLEINDKKYAPAEIKIIELSPEYEMLFGKFFNPYKRSFEVKFDRKDPDGNDIFPAETKKILLSFQSPDYYTSAHWDVGTTDDVKAGA